MIDGDHIISSILFFSHIMEGFDTQRQEAGILREGTEGTQDRKKAAHMCFTAIFQAMELRLSWYGLRGIPEPD